MTEVNTSDDLSMAPMEYHQGKDFQSTLERISFDVNQMINTFLALEQCAPSPSNTGFTAYLESCLLHIRKLIKFFIDPPNLGEISVRDFAPGARSLDLIQAPDLAPVRDVIDQYLVAENGLRTSDCSSEINAILGSVVAGLAKTFESFLDELPAGSTEKLLLENSTRVALEKLKTVEDLKE